MKPIPFVLLAMFVLTVYQGWAQPGFGTAGPKISWETGIEKAIAKPGTTLRGAARFSLDKEWHVNAHKPLDEFLIPTVLTLKEQQGIILAGIAYPEHTLYTFSFSPEPLAVYENIFYIGFTLQLDESLPPGDHELSFTLQYQACNDKLCAPPQNFAFPLIITIAEVDAKPLAALAPPWFVEVNWPGMVALSETDITDRGTETENKEEKKAGGRLSEADRDARIPEGKEDAATLPETGEWRALADRFAIQGRLAGYANKSAFLDFLDSARSGQSERPVTPAKGWWWMILVVLGGGVMLNLTPCVLPIIPINIAIIGAGARAGSRVRGFMLGGAYGLGIAAVYGALGLVVVLGLSAAFGALNSTAWFNGAIAVLFIVLALAMLDIIQIDFSKFQAKLGLGGGGGHILAALGMGAVSALLAGACVAPVVIYTILQAQDLYSQGHAIALALPFGLGVGMALPWPFLGAGLSLLPKPGVWMTRVKQGFAVFILGFALYYGHLAYTLYAPEQEMKGLEGPWTASLERGLAQAIEQQRPVIIDFWATWCKNCTVMDKTVLRDEEVLSKLDGYVKIKFQAESLTKPPVADVIDYFKVLGLPTFIVLEPKG